MFGHGIKNDAVTATREARVTPAVTRLAVV